ncbi:hypothetical protein [Nitrincola iocasae]|uniref:Uncharacterized protein n=1 Tax=Nitrincola iocasae TaxID=2614693 RepID=A0A5J6LAL9_9GAMM|nr:hypothetical protein [Nitrincola iocasae]QEW05659.1 hypothetical protein F5I99_03665 [Nitrincola iocasae]
MVQGSVSDYTLLGDQLMGQRMVVLFTRVDAPLPEVGNVYLLSEETTNSSGETTIQGEQQYIRVTKVEWEIRTYEDDRGTFERMWLKLEIGNALRRTFPGLPAVERLTRDVADVKTKFRLTQVADASRYYGIVRLEEAIAPGDLEIKAETIFGQLVPSATVESPVVDVQAGADRVNLQQCGSAYSLLLPNNDERTLGFGRAITPGTLILNTRSDNGQGQVLNADNSVYADVQYEEGIIVSRGSAIPASGSSAVTAAPAVAITDTAHTDAEEVKLANRGYNYTRTLRPIPQPGTLFVDYMAQGRWYRMQDNGNGQMSDEFGGAGTIDYASGSVIVTLGALPDTGSFIIYSWATPDNYEIRQQDQEIDPGYIMLEVSAGDIVPNSLTITWESGGGGATVTATDDGNGNLTGAATGRVVYGNGRIGIRPNLVPDSGAIFSVEYDQGFAVTETPALTQVGQSVTFTISDAPIRPGSFAAEYQVQEVRNQPHSHGFQGPGAVNNVTLTKTVTDDGAGGLVGASGSINYTTGEVTLFTDYDYTRTSTAVWTNPETGARETYDRISGEVAVLSSAVTVKYQLDSVLPETLTETIDAEDVSFNLTPLTRRYIIPGSIEFTWAGQRYIDREGLIYTDWTRQTGAALAVGTIDYSSGEVTLQQYTGGGSNAVQMHSMLLTPGAWFADGFYFRTPGAPLRPGSLFIRANLDNGTQITGSANFTGTIDSADMQGTVNWETGIVDVRFGRYVQDSTLTVEQKAEPWYNAANIETDGTIWVPHRVVPYTAKFNAVVYSMMPLDASILGLDPVRLPIDGRVPIIRAGEVIVIHNTQETDAGTVTAGQLITLPRDELAGAWLTDSTGLKVDPELYTVNRLAGTITIDALADLSTYDMPLAAHHRVEDMALVNEAEINGQLRLVGAIPRAYDPADTWISSAMIFGPLGSRARNVFSQASWTSVWSDQRIGSSTNAQYNNVLYPITVNNSNAIRERWAIIFTSSTTFNVVGETVGVITTGNTSADCTPINPVTGEPYFTIYAAGWGGGWATNNVLRFNTDAAHAPIWIARTTISGTPTADDDSFKLQIRGDAD